ncbi:MAG: branched-chain amino acid ABC transporter permease [Candidatus Abyssobacteria bacterium SURF_17]|uniref:Branched-chain amino acid ABC transporter permease n=1 Tax=Candidatus Abyssobacteria bacterium SURF_17 TaxID=2093361 RepID=A0A419F6I7_9BACT|nr:MAG: branched-chain amino acid ABC transporter permease [Candidatus Abyssubacteria bacterium SURF_17]
MDALAITLQYVFTGVAIGSIYAMVGLGFNIIYNCTGIINFAQGEFVMLGGMFMVTLTTVWKLPVGIAFPIAVLLVVLVGIGFERIAIHPLKNPSVLVLIMITIAGSILIKGLAMFAWGKEARYLPHFSGETPINIMGATILPQTLWVLASLLTVVVGLAYFFNRTLIGKAMRACAHNPDAARLVGISVKQMVTLSFGLSSGIGAIAGVVITPIILMDYQRGAMLALKGFGAAILGGLGSAPGAVLAGLLIGILESLGAGYISSHYKDAIALIVLLGVLFVRPGGLLGSADVQRLKKF